MIRFFGAHLVLFCFFSAEMVLAANVSTEKVPATSAPTATSDIPKVHKDVLKKAIAKYRRAALVEMKVNKIAISKLLNKESKHEGNLYFSGGLVRFEGMTPENFLVVYDGKYLWNFQNPSEKLADKMLIARGVIDPKNRQQLIVTELLSKESLFIHFNLTDSKEADGFVSVTATPKKDDWNLNKLILKISQKEELVVEMDYWDDVENETRLLLEQQKFESEKTAKEKKYNLFKFVPPKGVTVTHL